MKPNADYFIQDGVRVTPDGVTNVRKNEHVELRKIGLFAGAAALALLVAVATPSVSHDFHEYVVQPVADLLHYQH